MQLWKSNLMNFNLLESSVIHLLRRMFWILCYSSLGPLKMLTKMTMLLEPTSWFHKMLSQLLIRLATILKV
jgi:hypothetical protein